MYIMVLTWFLADPASPPLQVEQSSVRAAAELAAGCLKGGAYSAAIIAKRDREDRGGFTIANTLTCQTLFDIRKDGFEDLFERVAENLQRGYTDLVYIHRLEAR